MLCHGVRHGPIDMTGSASAMSTPDETPRIVTEADTTKPEGIIRPGHDLMASGG